MSNPSKEAQVRVFFALWPGEVARTGLAAWQAPLMKLCGGRVMPSENLHTTLVFLGGVARHRLEALLLAAQEVRGDPFEIHFDCARYWGHNHIAYAAPSLVPQALPQLVQALEQSLRRHRFRFDDREYKPHVTLLRHAKWSDAPLPPQPVVVWQVRDFALVQSVSDENGARYEVLASVSLAN